MIIDMAKVNKLLSSDITGDRIQAETGVNKTTIFYYRNGTTKVENMTVENAKKLADFWDVVKDEKPIDIKIKGVRNAVSDFNNWQGTARVFYDRADKKMWTNVYASENDTEKYHDESIVEIWNKLNILQRDDKVTMQQLRQAAYESEKNYEN